MKELSLNLFQNTELLGILLLSAAAVAVLKILFSRIPFRCRKEMILRSPLPFVKPSIRPAMTRTDWLVLASACVLYTIVSFSRLGSAVFPVTTWQPQPAEEHQSFILTLTDGTAFDQISVIYGEGDNNSNPDTWQLGTADMTIEGSDDLMSWAAVAVLEKGSIYEYQILTGSWDYRYIRITAASKNQTLTEIAFRKTGTDDLLPVSVYEDAYADSTYPAALVIDEQDKVVLDPTNYDEAYFDEIYHPRNAWEIAEGQYMYATVHPLLGTNIMALFIRLFGMSPLVWRLPGAIFGVMILPVFYLILKWMFRDTRLCTIGIILAAADFMHLTTSRIGTLEPFSVFFILLMFYWMIRYCRTSFYDTPLSRTLLLLLAGGISMGLAIAAKWTACYSAVGLAILLFSSWFRRWREYRQAGKLLRTAALSPAQENEARHIVSVFPKYFAASFALCFLFYLLIPACIYWLSYLPDHVWRNDSWSAANVWSQNLYMYRYHTDLTATHPYASTWYMWLLDARPIWYYGKIQAEGISHTIACFSNPLLTWAGLPAVLYTFHDLFRRRSRNALIIITGFLTALGPWILLVSRCVFAYHFYPTSFFEMLAIVYCAGRILEKNPQMFRILSVSFCAAYIFLFILFLPVTAGFGTTQTYIRFLEWLPGWYFG